MSLKRQRNNRDNKRNRRRPAAHIADADHAEADHAEADTPDAADAADTPGADTASPPPHSALKRRTTDVHDDGPMPPL